MIAGYVDFEFDLPEALLSRLVQVLEELEAAELSRENVAVIPEAQGVYQLYLDGKLVYVGKTDAEAGLSKRLARHSQKVRHRVGLEPARVAYKAVRIYVFTAMDLEEQPISYYGGLSAVSWNGSGFGSNDPGRRRDTTAYKEEHFDWQFPVDIDRDSGLSSRMRGSAFEVLSELKATLPYVFRYEGAGPRSRRPHPDLERTSIDFDLPTPVSARRVVEEVVSRLPEGWQATKLPSHIILYKESTTYAQGEAIATS